MLALSHMLFTSYTYVHFYVRLSYMYSFKRWLFKKFCYERLFIHKNNGCLTDFVHKYSAFYHTCTCEISKESNIVIGI